MAEGFEVKSSIHAGGWQGHNPEDMLAHGLTICGWQNQGDGVKLPMTFIEILCAKVEQSDWSFSGRKGWSRCTATGSITASGVEKLRRNFLYRVPGVGVGTYGGKCWQRQ